jgi:hypothetical protein
MLSSNVFPTGYEPKRSVVVEKPYTPRMNWSSNGGWDSVNGPEQVLWDPGGNYDA